MNQQMMMKFIALPQSKRDAIQALLNDPVILEVLPAFMPAASEKDVPVTGMTSQQKIWQSILSVLVILMPIISSLATPPKVVPVVAPPASEQPTKVISDVPASNSFVKLPNMRVIDTGKSLSIVADASCKTVAFSSPTDGLDVAANGLTATVSAKTAGWYRLIAKCGTASAECRIAVLDAVQVSESPVKKPPVKTQRQVAAKVTRGNHWTHPDTIENHLRDGHGVDPRGMTQEQMLNLHDSLHEGRASVTRH